VPDLATSRAGSPAAHDATSPAASEEQTPPQPAPLFPDQGELLASGGAAGHGSGSAGGAPMALLAGFVFIAPVLAHWLWAGTERRPRLLRAGRRERPG
jgi:hypothetical protein